jgi:hypothetical protein
MFQAEGRGEAEFLGGGWQFGVLQTDRKNSRELQGPHRRHIPVRRRCVGSLLGDTAWSVTWAAFGPGVVPPTNRKGSSSPAAWSMRRVIST